MIEFRLLGPNSFQSDSDLVKLVRSRFLAHPVDCRTGADRKPISEACLSYLSSLYGRAVHRP